MSAATTRLAEATIEVCARLAMAEEQARRDAAEIDRLRGELATAHEQFASQHADLVADIEVRERQLGLSNRDKRPPYQRVDRIFDALEERATRAENARQGELLRIERVLAHYEKVMGIDGTGRSAPARIIALIPPDIDPPPSIKQCAEACKVPRGGKFCIVCGEEEIPF